jgi:sugar/nucleoside kinase (ribokinase family)
MLFLMRGRGEPIVKSLRYASAAAAISITARGISSVPAFEQVVELIEVEESRP